MVLTRPVQRFLQIKPTIIWNTYVQPIFSTKLETINIWMCHLELWGGRWGGREKTLVTRENRWNNSCLWFNFHWVKVWFSFSVEEAQKTTTIQAKAPKRFTLHFMKLNLAFFKIKHYIKTALEYKSWINVLSYFAITAGMCVIPDTRDTAQVFPQPQSAVCSQRGPSFPSDPFHQPIRDRGQRSLSKL